MNFDVYYNITNALLQFIEYNYNIVDYNYNIHYNYFTIKRFQLLHPNIDKLSGPFFFNS